MVANKKSAAIGSAVSSIDSAEPVTSRGRQRKARILAAATELFLSAGYGETSIDAIVERSGGSKATIYDYFPTKAHLFRAVVDSIVSNQDEVSLGATGNVRETLVAFATRRLGVVFSDSHRALTRLIIAERERFPDIARMYYEQGPLRSHMVLRDYFEGLIEEGRLDTHSADEACEFFRGMLVHQRYVEQLYLETRPLSPEEITVRARHVVERFLDGYGHRDSG